MERQVQPRQSWRGFCGNNKLENMQQTLLNQGKLSAERAKKIQELGIRSKDDVWFENYEVVMRCLEEGVVLDNKHKRWLQRQKKADISDEKCDPAIYLRKNRA